MRGELPPPEAIDAALSRYTIGEELGRGALGVVYRGTDTRLGREVAIKVLALNPNNPEHTARFAREASAMASLNHPHIVTVYDYGSAGSFQYLAMELMAGGTLETGLSDGLPKAKALEWFRQICAALQHAHSLGIVHRDVKPSNVLLDRHGNAKLSDFGLAKCFEDEPTGEDTLTRSQVAMGTPLYMAPEQMAGSAAVDHRADIYSAGALLFEMLTGETIKNRYKPLSKLAGLPPTVDRVIDKALAPDPEDRFDRIDAFEQAMRLQPHRRKHLVRRLAAVYLVLASLAWQFLIAKPVADASPDGGLTTGLPMATFEEEIGLTTWEKIARYEFEQGLFEADKLQEDLVAGADTGVSDGALVFASREGYAEVDLTRRVEGPSSGVALGVRMRIDRYQERGIGDSVLLELSLRWDLGLFVVDPIWGQGGPEVLVSERERLAPDGVIGAHLVPGQWHELWLVIDEAHYSLWIDGEAVFRRESGGDLGYWSEWGQTQARLRLGGFEGRIDHVAVMERR